MRRPDNPVFSFSLPPFIRFRFFLNIHLETGVALDHDNLVKVYHRHVWSCENILLIVKTRILEGNLHSSFLNILQAGIPLSFSQKNEEEIRASVFSLHLVKPER